VNAPIAAFLREWDRKRLHRFHMPGHKGSGPLGCERWDITEVPGADCLDGAQGIIAQSEERTAGLFGARRTFYAVGGSSQCVRAMLHLAVTHRPAGTAPVVLAARNVHKSFVYAAGLIGFDAAWLWPEADGQQSVCACPVSPRGLDEALKGMRPRPCAVYITSPDYLGNIQDVAALARVCRRHGVMLLVDNAHGAYLRFLRPPRHPLDLGADLCCDSAHKTLPVLTGGAYLHIGKTAPAGIEDQARQAMALFGSTSPSYLTLASLDLCAAALSQGEPERIRAAAAGLEEVKRALSRRGWVLAGTEPLKLTLDAAGCGWTGFALADLLRAGGVEPEYADGEYVVLMASGSTSPEALRAVEQALEGGRPGPARARAALPVPKGEQALPIRTALFAPSETAPVQRALGRVCAAPTVACPPAVPIAISGEVIGPEALALLRHYGVKALDVVRPDGRV